MNTSPSLSRVLAVAVALVLTSTAAHAQLELMGTTFGVFSDPVGGTDMITNGNPVSTFATGVPYHSPMTSVKFSGDAGAGAFDLSGSGDQDNFGKLAITNGSDLIGTDATSVSMNLYADFTNIGLTDFDLTTLTFTFINTPDGSTPGGVPDNYQITASPINSFTYHNVLVSFTLLNVGDSNSFFGPDGRWIAEKNVGSENIILGVTETVLNPVPEPSTYALWGCALLLGAVVLKRRSLVIRALA